MSAKAGFTTGPWHWSKARTMQHLIGHPDCPLAVSMPLASNRSYFREGDGTREANARLIAAAPDLYAALQALYAACELRANKDGGDFGPDIGPAAELAERAFAKAEGTQ